MKTSPVKRTLEWFDAFGVELEYMIVDRESLSVAPICDRVLFDLAGSYEPEIELGEISWSNELALHVIELKTTDPTPALPAAVGHFQEHVQRINGILGGHDARLLPTAMHPWMDSGTELKLWPHEYNQVYESFHRIFDCRGHGWANLQSAHLNLPFQGDEQFGRLHAAIRIVLPLLPALAASSPVVDGRIAPDCDTRLAVYRTNQRRIPSITGLVVPESVASRRQYEEIILTPMYAEIAPHDPEGILQNEWLNARGAIARFDRNAIEIRVLDVQECPAADLAIIAITVEILRALVSERWSSAADQHALDTAALARLLEATTRDADRAVIDDVAYLRCLNCAGLAGAAAGDVWRRLADETLLADRKLADAWQTPLGVLLDEGPLARRILNRLDPGAGRPAIANVYHALADCLAHGRMLTGKP